MAAAMRFGLGFVLAMAGCAAASSANAAAIAGTVTGPDGKGFRGARPIGPTRNEQSRAVSQLPAGAPLGTPLI